MSEDDDKDIKRRASDVIREAEERYELASRLELEKQEAHLEALRAQSARDRLYVEDVAEGRELRRQAVARDEETHQHNKERLDLYREDVKHCQEHRQRQTVALEAIAKALAKS